MALGRLDGVPQTGDIVHNIYIDRATDVKPEQKIQSGKNPLRSRRMRWNNVRGSRSTKLIFRRNFLLDIYPGYLLF
jgi:hypothetical protein